MPVLYHITTKNEWESAAGAGFYASPSLNEEGFIHCCDEKQVPGVLERYFKNKKDLVKLVIDTEKLTSHYVFEWSPSTQDTFPHVYGPINTSAVTEVILV